MGEASLREVDWRFLLGRSRFGRGALIGGQGSMALRSIVGELVEPTATARCDVVVVERPSANALRQASLALAPDGWCIVSWPGRPRSRWLGALTPVSTWILWPDRRARAWIPVGDSAALGWLSSHAVQGTGLRPRRRLRWLVWSIRLAIGRVPMIQLARLRPSGTVSAATASIDWARLPDVGQAGGEPQTSILLTPGVDDLNKVVALTLQDAHPIAVGKVARTAAAYRGISGETAALKALAMAGLAGRIGVPELLHAGQLEDGRPLLIERAVTGTPLVAWLRQAGAETVFCETTDWLIQLAIATRTTAHKADPRAHVLTDLFGKGVTTATPNEMESLLALPNVMEHRDFAPWNLVRRADGSLGVLDWESATTEGWPGPDLLYFFAYAAVSLAGATGLEARVRAYRRAWDPHDRLGGVVTRSWERYCAAVGVPTSALRVLLKLTWALHLRSARSRSGIGTNRDAALFRRLAREDEAISGISASPAR